MKRTRYAVLLDLSLPKHFNAWRADPADMAAVFSRWVRQLEEMEIYEARVICPQLPESLYSELARSPRVVFHPAFEPAAHLAALQRAAPHEGEFVLLTGGTVWIEPLLDKLVAEHRQRGNTITVCPFHAGFSPIIMSAGAINDMSPSVGNLEKHLLRRADDPSSGVARIRRPLPNMNLYARPDCDEGWQCLAWMSRAEHPREFWRSPQKFREGFIATRENYRRSFRAMSVFKELEGARVLEIGCSPALELGPKMLLEEFGVRTYDGVNLDPFTFEWRDPRATFHTGDAARVPFRPASFDLVFSLAVWEHVQNPKVLFHKVPGWLTPGGGHYGKFQVWSSSHGYHLPPGGFPTARQPAFCHLTMSHDDLRMHLAKAVPDAALVERGVDRVFRDEYINRVRAADFLDIIRTSGLEVVYLDGRCNGRISPEARRAAAQLSGQYTPEELSLEGFEFYLRKSDFRIADVLRPIADVIHGGGGEQPAPVSPI